MDDFLDSDIDINVNCNSKIEVIRSVKSFIVSSFEKGKGNKGIRDFV